MATYHFNTTFEPDAMTLSQLLENRSMVERTIENLICLLDYMDEDCDLEDDELHDDALDILGEDPRCSEAALIYSIDQSEGPINWKPPW